MSDRFHPVPCWIGLTNSVQPYWKFAIMIMATSAAPSWNQRLWMFIAPPPRCADGRVACGARQAASRTRIWRAWRALRPRAVRLADTQAVSFRVMDHPRLCDVGRKIRERSHDAPRFDRRRDDAAGIDALEPQTVQRAADSLEVPPRNAVLRGHDDGVRTEQRTERRRDGRQTVRLDAEDDDVRRADRVQIAGHFRPDVKIPFGAEHAKAPLAHGLQVRTAREQHDVGTGARQPRADVPADRAGARDDDLHDGCCEYRRDTAPP